MPTKRKKPSQRTVNAPARTTRGRPIVFTKLRRGQKLLFQYRLKGDRKDGPLIVELVQTGPSALMLGQGLFGVGFYKICGWCAGEFIGCVECREPGADLNCITKTISCREF